MPTATHYPAERVDPVNSPALGGTAANGLDISVHVGKSGTQTVNNNTNTIMSWNTEDYDTNGMHDNVVNNSRLTSQSAGFYFVESFISIDDGGGGAGRSGTGSRLAQVVQNGGATVGGSCGGINDGTADTRDVYVGGLYRQSNLVVGDYLEIWVLQDSGGTVNVKAESRYWAQKMGAAPDVRARVQRAAALSVVSGTLTVVPLDVESYDTDGMHDNAVNNSRITAQRTGKFWFGAVHRWDINGTGRRRAKFRLNGSASIGGQNCWAQTSALDISSVSGIRMVQMVVGDYVEMLVNQFSGANLNLQSTSDIQVVRVDNYG